jgi:hypothetical protein
MKTLECVIVGIGGFDVLFAIAILVSNRDQTWTCFLPRQYSACNEPKSTWSINGRYSWCKDATDDEGRMGLRLESADNTFGERWLFVDEPFLNWPTSVVAMLEGIAREFNKGVFVGASTLENQVLGTGKTIAFRRRAILLLADECLAMLGGVAREFNKALILRAKLSRSRGGPWLFRRRASVVAMIEGIAREFNKGVFVGASTTLGVKL